MLVEGVLRAKRVGNRLADERSVAQRSEPDPEDTVLGGEEQGRGLERKPCFPRAAGACEGEKASFALDACEQLCELEALVIVSFLRGLSVRDVEAALEEAFDGPVVSKSTVSRICTDTRERYRAWCRRRLDEHDLVYCFLDAVYLKLRPDDTPAEGVLVAWASRSRGARYCSVSCSEVARATRPGSTSGAT